MVAPGRSSVPPAAIVVVPDPLIVPLDQFRAPLTVRFPLPVEFPWSVRVPLTVTVAPKLIVRPEIVTVVAIAIVGWFAALETVTVSAI